MKPILLLLLILASIPASAGELREGVYQLKGSSPGKNPKSYSGEVIIKKFGEAYRLQWIIGPTQRQMGQAFLEGNILSVAYMDASGLDFGVVSYKAVSEEKLEGKWCPMGANSCGIEILEFQGEQKDKASLNQDCAGTDKNCI